MSNESKAQLLRSWIVLLALTGASILAVNFAGAATGLMLVLFFAIFKARFVVADFMGLRRRAAMRRALLGWCMLLAIMAAAKTAISIAAAG